MSADWQTRKLSEVCQIKPPKKEAKELLSEDDLVSFVPMNDLGIRRKELALKEEKPLGEVVGSYTYFAENDVLLAKITPCFENGKLGIARGLKNGVGFGSSEYIVFRSNGEIVSEYLFYYLSQNSFRDEGAKVMAGAVGHKRVPKEFIEDHPIPLPSLEEQKRIVTILDEAFVGIDAAIANTEKILANARELFESYLQKIFNQGWELKPLESFSNIVNGYAFKSGDFSPQNEVKSIKITNVGVYEFVHESDNYLPKDFLEVYGRYKAYEGDVVVALTRTIISSGLKVAVVPAEYDGALINQRVAAVQVDEEVMPKQILQAFLSTKMAIDYVRSNVNELMQPNLSIKDLKAFPVPVPPADKISSVTSQITEIREKTDQLAALYITKLDSLKELKQSLLQKAFSGELTAEADLLKEEAVA